jgi:hypothetical protein
MQVTYDQSRGYADAAAECYGELGKVSAYAMAKMMYFNR